MYSWDRGWSCFWWTDAFLIALYHLKTNASWTLKCLHDNRADRVPDFPDFSEYLAECDARRAFISGFTGSAGMFSTYTSPFEHALKLLLLGLAIVDLKTANLFTDGRYFLQAGQQLDSWVALISGTHSLWLNSWAATGYFRNKAFRVILFRACTNWYNLYILYRCPNLAGFPRKG